MPIACLRCMIPNSAEDKDFFQPPNASLLSVTTNLFVVSDVESILLDAKIDGIEELDTMYEEIAGD